MEEFVRSAGLELMQVEVDDGVCEPAAQRPPSNETARPHSKETAAAVPQEGISAAEASSQEGVKQGGNAAMSAVAGVAERVASATDKVASATDTAASVGKKVAQKMFKGANRALARLNKEMAGDANGTEGEGDGSGLRPGQLTVL